MTVLIISILLVLSIYFLGNFLTKKNILLSFTGDDHQSKTGDTSVPLSGGFILSILFSIIFIELNYLFFLLSLILIFIIGISSDLKLIISPKFRLLLQTIVVLTSVHLLDLNILTTRIPFFDFVLSNHYINIIFTIFCMVIVINGTNLIDGLNGLVLGYFLIVFYFLFKLTFFELSFFSLNIVF